jgi:SAM-dependent methyltransferase
MTWDTVTPYNRGFREFTEAYEAFGFEDIHRDAMPFLPTAAGLILDVGAGSGRDAAWFASRGWEVVAVEPARAMRGEAERLHPDSAIRWVEDRLPALATVHRQGVAYDLIWLSGVWQHIAPEDRGRAMRKLATLLKPGGRMVLTLRHGPAPDDRPMWVVSAQEVEKLGLDHGLALRVATERSEDLQGRSAVRWQTVVLDLPDDGAGALPLLRGVILRQERSATYKLALLRCIARIADGSPNAAQDAGDDVEIPLGLIALYWIRMFKPLVEQNLPQRPGERMGFVKDAFHALRAIAPYELRVGARFQGDLGLMVAQAVLDASRLIADMPARHLTYADDRPVFETEARRAPKPGAELRLTQEVLWSYGRTRVPLPVWSALRRMAAWIEPMLMAEWVRQTRAYAERAGRSVSTDEVLSALRWLEPERDTAFVRGIVQQRLIAGEPVTCVWSGLAMKRHNSIDIDHCLPWSAWPCGDLWNLLPASAQVNRHGKRERIVAARTLAAARPRIVEWWQTAYAAGSEPVQARFLEEARTTLPLTNTTGALDLQELFAALDFQRLRLRQETTLPEWSGIF